MVKVANKYFGTWQLYIFLHDVENHQINLLFFVTKNRNFDFHIVSLIKKDHKTIFLVKNSVQKIYIFCSQDQKLKKSFKASTTLQINHNFQNFQQKKWELYFFFRYKNLHYIECNLQYYVHVSYSVLLTLIINNILTYLQ